MIIRGRVSSNGTRKKGDAHLHKFIVSIEIIKEQGKRVIIISVDELTKKKNNHSYFSMGELQKNKEIKAGCT